MSFRRQEESRLRNSNNRDTSFVGVTYKFQILKFQNSERITLTRLEFGIFLFWDFLCYSFPLWNLKIFLIWDFYYGIISSTSR
jgi:hypothetical protein